jgi:hypothetical protein
VPPSVADAVLEAFNPNQPRDRLGRFRGGFHVDRGGTVYGLKQRRTHGRPNLNHAEPIGSIRREGSKWRAIPSVGRELPQTFDSMEAAGKAVFARAPEEEPVRPHVPDAPAGAEERAGLQEELDRLLAEAPSKFASANMARQARIKRLRERLQESEEQTMDLTTLVAEAARGGLVKCPECETLNGKSSKSCKSCGKAMGNVTAKAKRDGRTDVSEAATSTADGKPGTNWSQVTGEDRKRVNPLVKHYMGKAHPFQSCVNDNTKRFGPERARKVCAVVKDMGERRTTWRKGPKAQEGLLEEFTGRLLEAAEGEAQLVVEALLTQVPPTTRAILEAADEQRVQEAIRGQGTIQGRGGNRGKVPLKRMPDGQFAPKGMGRVLRPGDTVELPDGRTGKFGTDGWGGVGVKLSDGSTIDVYKDRETAEKRAPEAAKAKANSAKAQAGADTLRKAVASAGKGAADGLDGMKPGAPAPNTLARGARFTAIHSDGSVASYEVTRAGAGYGKIAVRKNSGGVESESVIDASSIAFSRSGWGTRPGDKRPLKPASSESAGAAAKAAAGSALERAQARRGGASGKDAGLKPGSAGARAQARREAKAASAGKGADHTAHSARAAAEGRSMNSDEQRADRAERLARAAGSAAGGKDSGGGKDYGGSKSQRSKAPADYLSVRDAAREAKSRALLSDSDQTPDYLEARAEQMERAAKRGLPPGKAVGELSPAERDRMLQSAKDLRAEAKSRREGSGPGDDEAKIKSVAPGATIRRTKNGLEIGGFSGDRVAMRRKLEAAGLEVKDVWGQLVVVPKRRKAQEAELGAVGRAVAEAIA